VSVRSSGTATELRGRQPMDRCCSRSAPDVVRAGGRAASAELRHGSRRSRGSGARGFSLDRRRDGLSRTAGCAEPFGRTRAVARAWVPLGWPFLALRAGGEKLWGDVPVHEAAFLGGRNRCAATRRTASRVMHRCSAARNCTLRSARSSCSCAAKLGVFGLADAGSRVSSMVTSAGRLAHELRRRHLVLVAQAMLSLAYARGDIGRLYLRLGMPL
jgi:hypothetical protein